VSSNQLDLGRRGRLEAAGPRRAGHHLEFDLQGGTASTMIGHMRPLSQIVVPTVFPAQ